MGHIIRYEELLMINRQDLSKVGIGTWGVGGFAERNPNNDDQKQINAMIHMLKNDMNYIELNIWTSQGQSVEIASKAVERSGVSRDKLFLSQAIYFYTAPDLESSKKELESMLKQFSTSYMDSISLSGAAISAIGKDKVYAWYNELLSSNKVRYINLNNPSLGELKEARKVFGDKLFSIEIGFNFEIRENEENGIINFANANDILCVIYQPLRRNRTANRNWPLLVELADKYGKTQNQILLNWIASRELLPLTKSETISHINEHLDSTTFQMDKAELDKLNAFRPPNYIKPQVYWGPSGEGVRIDQLSNVFDEDYDKQIKKS
jgi:diketogulonate reductase-like aldo/keto reductase